MSEPSSEHVGAIATRFWTIIPFLLGYSVSHIGRPVGVVYNSEQIRVQGAVYSLHITPFFAIGYVRKLHKL